MISPYALKHSVRAIYPPNLASTRISSLLSESICIALILLCQKIQENQYYQWLTGSKAREKTSQFQCLKQKLTLEMNGESYRLQQSKQRQRRATAETAGHPAEA
jgi:hypothetical protein